MRLSFRTLTFLPLAAHAATLTMVPMQGGMVMPMIAYHAADSSLTVTMEPAIVQLTPLLISNPNDAFGADDPWYHDLDPAGRGLSFSRRYGFVMGTMSDPLPAGTAIWIRKVSLSPGLMAWRFRGNPKTWEPIFGTEGSSDVYQWDSTMFHPTFAAEVGTNTFTAVFDAYLVSSASGEPLPNGSTGPFALAFTNMLDGRPRLSITAGEMRWQASATNFMVEYCTDLSNPVWVAETNSNAIVGSQCLLKIDPAAGTRYYRLSRPR